jgi:hypothetical protein
MAEVMLGKPVIRHSPAKLGSGQRFKALASTLGDRPGVTDPAALAAAIGRKKYVAKKMAALSARG